MAIMVMEARGVMLTRAVILSLSKDQFSFPGGPDNLLSGRAQRAGIFLR
jgi:hypothetical protein